MCKYVLDIYEWIENKRKIYKHIRQMSINRHFFLPNKILVLGFVITLTSVITVATKTKKKRLFILFIMKGKT